MWFEEILFTKIIYSIEFYLLFLIFLKYCTFHELIYNFFYSVIKNFVTIAKRASKKKRELWLQILKVNHDCNKLWNSNKSMVTQSFLASSMICLWEDCCILIAFWALKNACILWKVVVASCLTSNPPTTTYKLFKS